MPHTIEISSLAELVSHPAEYSTEFDYGPDVDWIDFAYIRMDDFPRKVAIIMAERWSDKDQPDGLYKHDIKRIASDVTLANLEKYSMRWGIPVAPEAIEASMEEKILVILEG